MSSDDTITVKDVSKAYAIYAAPLDRLKQAIVPRLLRSQRMYFKEHWANRDISFTVKRGESVAIIGRNGSGKSTLLKQISGTLTPTSGEITVRGKVAALLELGSGFNPEFTGRENVVLNASILGMAKEEIDQRLADIIAFAEIDDFIDQPVKTYSTGMAMRLAFSVITHVDADVLIVDEALAVGDAYFAQKCLRWLRQFRERGTILFCGHDTGAVMTLCDRAIWIDGGKMVHEGTAKEVCEAYSVFVMEQTMGLKSKSAQKKKSAHEPVGREGAETEIVDGQQRPRPIIKRNIPPPPNANPVVFEALDDSNSFGSGDAELTNISLTTIDGSPLTWIEGGEAISIRAQADIKKDLAAPIAGFHVKDRLGQAILGDNTFLQYAGDPLTCSAGETLNIRFDLYLPNLASGRYSLTMAFASGTLEQHVQHHWVHDAVYFDVHSPFKNGVLIAPEMISIALTTDTQP
jgi:lipopolysaccharide transport system ATP-binding protein